MEGVRLASVASSVISIGTNVMGGDSPCVPDSGALTTMIGRSNVMSSVGSGSVVSVADFGTSVGVVTGVGTIRESEEMAGIAGVAIVEGVVEACGVGGVGATDGKDGVVVEVVVVRGVASKRGVRLNAAAGVRVRTDADVSATTGIAET